MLRRIEAGLNWLAAAKFIVKFMDAVRITTVVILGDTDGRQQATRG